MQITQTQPILQNLFKNKLYSLQLFMYYVRLIQNNIAETRI